MDNPFGHLARKVMKFNEMLAVKIIKTVRCTRPGEPLFSSTYRQPQTALEADISGYTRRVGLLACSVASHNEGVFTTGLLAGRVWRLANSAVDAGRASKTRCSNMASRIPCGMSGSGAPSPSRRDPPFPPLTQELPRLARDS